MEVSIIKNYELVKNYNFSIAQNKRLYSLAVLQLAILDLKALKVGIVKLSEKFLNVYGYNLGIFGINATVWQLVLGALVLGYLFHIDTVKKMSIKDILLSVLITVGLVLIIIL